MTIRKHLCWLLGHVESRTIQPMSEQRYFNLPQFVRCHYCGRNLGVK
jgi:hypothetical protein